MQRLSLCVFFNVTILKEMPRSRNIFMTVDTYCQITFISTWMIHRLHKLNMFRTELIITPPHLHLFLLFHLLSRWLAWPDAQAPSSLTPVLLSTYSIHHQSLTFTPKELSHAPVHFVPSPLHPSSDHHRFPRGMKQQPLDGSPWAQSFSLSSGSLFAE